MRLYLAGINGIKEWIKSDMVNPSHIYVLESFVSIKDWQIKLIPVFKDFILDSGAFTFINSKKEANIDWFEYAERYATFIRKYQIERYFELDIDSIIGLSKTTELRRYIEKIVGWPSIPVWHETRNKEYWFEMCKTHPYVAIGGIASKKSNRRRAEAVFPWFIRIAHKYGAKIHGLGYTKTENLKQLRFDSIDSTTWTSGGDSENCIYSAIKE